MKIYVSCIEGHVPDDMVRAVRAFVDFTYIVRRDIHNESSLRELDDAFRRFDHFRRIYVTTGVRMNFSLPRQHSMGHYHTLIRAYGAPNGLCSSITESKHIVAVKKPWRRSNHHNALGQMLLTNQRLDKLAAMRVDFTRRKMLEKPCLVEALSEFSNMSRT